MDGIGSGSGSGMGGPSSNQTWQELEGQRRKEAELRQKIHRYEAGDKGTLHPVISGIMRDWMDFTHKLGESLVRLERGLIWHSSCVQSF